MDINVTYLVMLVTAASASSVASRREAQVVG